MSDDNITELHPITRMNKDPNRILGKPKGSLKTVIVIGYDLDGNFYFDSSTADGGEALWLLESAKRGLFKAAEEYQKSH